MTYELVTPTRSYRRARRQAADWHAFGWECLEVATWSRRKIAAGVGDREQHLRTWRMWLVAVRNTRARVLP
jgi:hypothetical protein